MMGVWWGGLCVCRAAVLALEKLEENSGDQIVAVVGLSFVLRAPGLYPLGANSTSPSQLE
jgi:hypothetical protein